MVIEKVPLVNIRQKHLIKVYSFPVTEPFDAYTFNPDIQSLVQNLEPIGGVQSVEISSERELYSWRELNFDTLGRVMEVYPSLGEFTVSVSKIAFYKEHLLDAFKAVKADMYSSLSGANDPVLASFNVYNQIAPIHIVISALEKDQNNQEITRFIMIYDCWFNKSEITFSITDDNLAIIQSAELTAAGIFSQLAK